MAKSIVVYSTKYGSTGEIARAVAEGLGADLASVDDDPDLRPYQLVVLGSPVYNNDYTPPMVEFVSRSRPVLAKKKIAAFICAAATWVPVASLSGDEDEAAPTQQLYADGLARMTGGDVVAARGFGGRMDPEQLDKTDRGLLEWIFQYFMRQPLLGFDLLDPASAYRWGEDLRDVVGG